jgi:hypothetical protein
MMCALCVIRSTTAFARRASGNTLVHSPNGRFVVTISDQRSPFVALGDDLEDELGGAVREGQIPQLVQDEDLDAAAQRVDVPLEERLLALRLERHHEARAREARAHQEQAEHRRHAREADGRLTPVDLRGHPRVVHLRAERLSGEPELAAPLADVIAHRRPGNHNAVLVGEAISDPLRGVPLLGRRVLVSDQDLIDPLPMGPERRRRPPRRPLALGRQRRFQRLPDRSAVHPVLARQRVQRQPSELAIPADILEQLHS